MAENTEYTLTAYLGPEFQQRLMWQLLVEPEFAEKTIPNLAVEYFDDPNLKRLFIIILEFYKAHGKVPNLQNQSILQAINTYKTPNNIIEEESLFAVIKRIEMWNERVLNKQILHDGDVIRTETTNFIKQQEYRKTGEFIITSTKNGDIRKKTTIASIEEKFHKIQHIGDEEDYGISVFDNIDHALRKEFRQTIATGVGVIDTLTGGGLGKGEIGVILTPSGVGKSLPLSANLLTPEGWIKMGDVKLNDLVVGSDGRPTKVLGVYPQGKRPIYKIEFNDQTTAYCDEEHIWSVNSLNQRTANTTHYIDGKPKHIKTPDFSYNPITTKELIKNYVIYNKNHKKLNYRIPIVKAVEFNKKELLINSYLLGALIGDGGLTQSSIRFTSIDDDIINRINNIINDQYEDLSLKQISKTISYSITGKKGKKNKLYELIKDLKLNVTSNKKFIPKEYLYSSIEDRISLLQGLMDTDGYTSKSGRIQFTTASKDLVYDVRELVLSLGGFCRMCEKLPKYKYKNEIKIGQKSYILTISFLNDEIKPFFLKRKQDRVVYRDKYKFNKYISNISYSHEEEAQCIYVENKNHLYVIDDYILTHNTTLLTKIANTAYDECKNVCQIIFEDTKEQIQRKHFTIWSNIALSKTDENCELVKQLTYKKASEMVGKGNLIIKRFSQENTTMMDIRSWMLRHQKKYGYKFDILVLDYLDCLESHKKTPDRNEAELVIIKSFEALAADFDIPAWTAIQTNRSGFNAEYVEAYQSGGSIKRVQKAHFFMSVAKTADQKEANLASIRIIKARFAQDGQTFTDCIFNNDTMQIIIEDKRYPVRTILKHHDSEDVNEINNTANEIIKKSSDIDMHAAINKRVISLTEMVNDPTINDDPVDLKQFEKITEKKDAEIINMHIETTRTDQSINEIKQIYDIAKEALNETENDDGLIEIDENDAVTDAVNEGVNNITNPPKKDDLLDWSGKTETVKTNEIEIKLEDISLPKEIIAEGIVQKYDEINKNNRSYSPPKEKIILSREEIEEAEKNMKNPDEPSTEHMTMHERLKLAEIHQNLMKKK
ncbi:MAG: LAGLIDADG family homing endonuclease [Candidatus Paceibacterota bacterium]|jgi:replicative DNA helicase